MIRFEVVGRIGPSSHSQDPRNVSLTKLPNQMFMLMDLLSFYEFFACLFGGLNRTETTNTGADQYLPMSTKRQQGV